MRWTCLAGGLLVASARRPGARSATVGLLCRAGSRHEAAGQHGLAHLYEHMAFKGTARRSAQAIAEEMEDRGGLLNAWTDRDATLFHARVLPADLPHALDLVTDIALHPRLDPADLDLERQVIEAEIGEAADQPADQAHDLLWATAFPAQALGRNILGDTAGLARLDAQSCRAWLAGRYRRPSMAIVAAGRVDHRALEDAAAGLLADLPEAAASPPAPPAVFREGAARLTMRAEQVHWALGWQASPAAAGGALAEQVFAMAAGGGMSSRLFQALREQRGLVYDVGASVATLDDMGLLVMSLAARPALADGARELALATLDATARGLEPSELARAVAQARAQLEMALESGPGLVDWMARSIVVHGRPRRPAELLRELARLTVDEVRAAGQRLLAAAPAEARVGPRAAKGRRRGP